MTVRVGEANDLSIFARGCAWGASAGVLGFVLFQFGGNSALVASFLGVAALASTLDMRLSRSIVRGSLLAVTVLVAGVAALVMISVFIVVFFGT
jgi:hypothetical protein